jgi:hypothetical protein
VLAAACVAFMPCAAHAAAPYAEPAVVRGSNANFRLLTRVFCEWEPVDARLDA